MEQLIERVKSIIDICWDSFSAKVGCGLIVINKEASMQMQFAYVLKNTLDLSIYNDDESVELELETAIPVNGSFRECDIVVQITKANSKFYLPIEVKCYKEYASSGGKRGASDVFMMEVYRDLELLENYSVNPNYINGMGFIMTNLSRLVFPRHKNGKKWNYDISDGTSLRNPTFKDTPMGGKKVNLTLNKNYDFNWNQINEYFFLKLEAE